MRKMYLFVSMLVVVSFMLTACGSNPTSVVPTQTARVVEVIVTATPEAAVAKTATSVPTLVPTLVPTATETSVPTVEPTLVPTATETSVSTVELTSVSTSTSVSVLSSLQLQTATEVRNFFKTGTLKWVAGGEGLWVAGAQGSLVKALTFADMPEGMTVEVQCVQYHNFDGELVIKEVCANSETRFSKAVPAGTVVTVWLEWVVEGSANESWPEGFIDKPCVCPDGDCRDE